MQDSNFFFTFLYLFTSLCSVCDSGKWQCSENFCPARCVVEGQYVTTYDGKQYSVPGKCTYVASQVTHFSLNHHLPPTLLYKLTARLYFFRVTTGGYTLSISKGRPLWRQLLFSFFRYKQPETATLITFNQITFNMKVQVYNFPSFLYVWICQETFHFSHSIVRVGEKEIPELYQSGNQVWTKSCQFHLNHGIWLWIWLGALVIKLTDKPMSISEHALVYWESSIYVQVHTSFGLKVQVQVFPEVQLYVTPPANHTGPISGSRLARQWTPRIVDSLFVWRWSRFVFQAFVATTITTPLTISPPAAGSSRIRLSLSPCPGVWRRVQWTYPPPVLRQTMVHFQYIQL